MRRNRSPRTSATGWRGRTTTSSCTRPPTPDFDVALKPGASGGVRLLKPGVISYICRYHPGMKGQIVVTEVGEARLRTTALALDYAALTDADARPADRRPRRRGRALPDHPQQPAALPRGLEHPADRGEAEEAVQDGYLKAFAALPTFRGEAPLPPGSPASSSMRRWSGGARPAAGNAAGEPGASVSSTSIARRSCAAPSLPNVARTGGDAHRARARDPGRDRPPAGGVPPGLRAARDRGPQRRRDRRGAGPGRGHRPHPAAPREAASAGRAGAGADRRARRHPAVRRRRLPGDDRRA